MSTVIEKVYTDRNNVITLTLSEDGIPVPDHTQFTRVVLKFGLSSFLSDNLVETVDSDVNSGYFDLTNTDYIVLKLGEAGLPKGRFWCEVVVYTAQAPLGVVWEPPMEVIIQ